MHWQKLFPAHANELSLETRKKGVKSALVILLTAKNAHAHWASCLILLSVVSRVLLPPCFLVRPHWILESASLIPFSCSTYRTLRFSSPFGDFIIQSCTFSFSFSSSSSSSSLLFLLLSFLTSFLFFPLLSSSSLYSCFLLSIPRFISFPPRTFLLHLLLLQFTFSSTFPNSLVAILPHSTSFKHYDIFTPTAIEQKPKDKDQRRYSLIYIYLPYPCQPSILPCLSPLAQSCTHSHSATHNASFLLTRKNSQ
ncbi:hypothetical protein K457DRAFT_189236 [Linnemannia elongata AG-77]|uniref:Uncharacterized protein n=1 Tax=Linnemannia elongata AG-77 TaxID=1314771 RepID=A0A197KC41_9FUNG|nr:hypothetical protein K457DRAFT_189236 [Linnemannia elongata AG-77]